MGYTPPAGKELAYTGGAGLFGFSLTQSVLMLAVCLVIGGVLVAAAKLGPRIAIEPVASEQTGKYSMRLTINGKPRRKK